MLGHEDWEKLQTELESLDNSHRGCFVALWIGILNVLGCALLIVVSVIYLLVTFYEKIA